MSDFDKEAEREKLRKKLADDEEKRAGTRRMSELLLKGATMTNKHCGQCSDPLFRYDGQTFCPSCQAEGASPQADGTPQRTDDTGGQTAADAQPQVDAAERQSEPTADPQSTPTPEGRQPADRTESAQSQRASSLDSQQNKTQAAGAVSSPATAGDLAEARQSLTRTLTRFARMAEQTDDPRRARELLAAAREAAATLSELE